jgi:hypothetical protein
LRLLPFPRFLSDHCLSGISSQSIGDISCRGYLVCGVALTKVVREAIYIV